jgi:diguanylate cyclase (GGDEF)-like protein
MASRQLNQLNRHLLRQALDVLPVPALIVDAETRDCLVLYANEALAVLAGMTTGELIGRSFRAVAAAGPAADTDEPWRLRCRSGDILELRAAPLYQRPGRPGCWLLTTAARPVALAPVTPASEPEATAARFDAIGVGVFGASDAWARAGRDERLDGPTGLASRAAFAEVLQRDFALARRDQRRLSVVVFRIDAFESYLTLFGRHAADSCLRKVGHAIASSVRRAGDYCARVGHDRFAVLMTGGDEGTAEGHGARIAQRVRDLAIHHPRSLPARYVTVSWQLASAVPLRTAEEADLLDIAEAALPPPGDSSGQPARGQG